MLQLSASLWRPQPPLSEDLTASGAANIAITAAAAAIMIKLAGGEATIAITAAALALASKPASGTATIAITAAAASAATKRVSGAALLAVTAAAAAISNLPASGSATIAITAEATTQHDAVAAGSASISLSATASCVVTARVASAVSISIATEATNQVDLQAAGAATIAITATANSLVGKFVSANVTIAINAAAVSVIAEYPAVGAATIAITAAAATQVNLLAAGAASIVISAVAATIATKRVSGAATLAITATGSIVANRPASGAASIAITAAAATQVDLLASGAATIALTAAAASLANKRVAGAATIAVTGAASALANKRVAGTASIAITATAEAEVTEGGATADVRVTEAGDVRITETGDRRVIVGSGGDLGLQTAFGSFNTGTGTDDIVISGLGFEPKAVIFWWSGRTDTTEAVGGGSIYRGTGMAISPTVRRCNAIFSEDAADTPDADTIKRIDACIAKLDDTAGVDGLADLDSMDPDGFTIAIDDAFSISMTVHYLALGGDELLSAMGEIESPLTSGTEDVTSPGFEPTALLIQSHVEGGGIGNNYLASVGRMQMGMSDGVDDFTQAIYTRNGGSIDIANTYNYLGEIFGEAGAAINDIRAELLEWLVDGFRVDWTEVWDSGQYVLGWLALAGLQVKVGTITTRNDGNDISVSGLAFTPKAILFMGSGPLATQDVVTADQGRWCVGAATSPSSRGCHATKNVPDADVSEVGSAVRFDAVWADMADNDTIRAVMDLKSIEADGFTCVMDTPDSNISVVGYIAFGDPA